MLAMESGDLQIALAGFHAPFAGVQEIGVYFGAHSRTDIKANAILSRVKGGPQVCR
jgi:hypothetical protein